MHLVLSWNLGRDGAACRRPQAQRTPCPSGARREILDGAGRSADRNAFHLWLELPEHWRADTFVSAAALPRRRHHAGERLRGHPGPGPNAVRIAISAPPVKELERGLQVLRTLLSATPNDVAME